MTLESRLQSELRRLVTDLVDARLTEEGRERLNTLLAEQPAAREYFAACMAIHVELLWRHTTAPHDAAPRSAEPPRRLPTPSAEAIQSASSPLAPVARNFDWRRRPLAFFSMVLAVWGLYWLVLGTSMGPRYESAHLPRASQSVHAAPAARLVDAHQARWAQGAPRLSLGTPLAAGARLKLEAGFAEIAYPDGARVLLQAPGTFVVGRRSPNSTAGVGRLEAGRATVKAPESARGFTLHTPDATIVDLGTEFGVAVAPELSTEVSTFEGAVEILPSQAPEAKQRVAAGESFRVTASVHAAGAAVQPLAFTAAPFVRTISAARTTDQEASPATASELPVTDGLALHFSADYQVLLDRKGRIYAWGDRLGGGNLRADNAWQRDPALRPRLAMSPHLGGSPVVRFEGSHSGFVTSPFNLGDDQTVLAVFPIDEKTMHGYRKFFNGNGPPHVTFDVGDRRVLCRMSDDAAYHGQLQTRLPTDEPYVVGAYVYSHRQNTAKLYLNGRLQKRGTAPAKAGCGSAKRIGNHLQFPNTGSAELAELLVYDRALTDEQIASVSRCLWEKYQAPTPPALRNPQEHTAPAN